MGEIKQKTYYEDYRVGEILSTPGRTICEADIHAFASLTGDWHPLHTNVEYAKATQFGERIAHGMLVFSVGMALMFRLGEHVVLAKSFIAFYGLEKVRFVTPVKIGDTIRLEVEVIGMTPKDKQRGLVETISRIINQREEVCCIYTAKSLCGRAPQDISDSTVAD